MWFLPACVVILLGLSLQEAIGGIGCRDNMGNPVDWFIVYKLPRLSHGSSEPVQNGVGQAYMDVNKQNWVLLDKGIDEKDHAIYYTLNQIYKNAGSQNAAYLLYNDEVPDGPVSFNHGHTKGDIAFDKSSGFWLVHSVPKFPPFAKDGYSYPKTGTVYGQTFLCFTLNYNQFNSIGGQLLYNYPKIYDYNLPEALRNDNPDMANAVNGTHVSQQPWNKKVTLTSSGARQFVSFAKFSNFGQDLYHDFVASSLSTGLLAETWQHGRDKLNSDCSQFTVLNVMGLKILKDDFSETEDHAKWAVAYNSKYHEDDTSRWICIGDINRMESQTKRAGGTVCSNIAGAWKMFNSSITGTEPCNDFRRQKSRYILL